VDERRWDVDDFGAGRVGLADVAVLPEHLAVVGGKDDERFLEYAACFQRVENEPLEPVDGGVDGVLVIASHPGLVAAVFL
jgi:hypothetical protein